MVLTFYAVYIVFYPYLCFISFLYLDLCVLGDGASISKGSFMQAKHLCGVSTQLQPSGLVAHENSTFRNLALAVSGPFMA